MTIMHSAWNLSGHYPSRLNVGNFGPILLRFSSWLKTHALGLTPADIAAQVLPDSPQAPKHLELSIGEVFQEAKNDQPADVAPVVVATVGDLLLQQSGAAQPRGRAVLQHL